MALLCPAADAKSKTKKKKIKPPPTLTLSASLTSGPGVAVAHSPVGLSIEYPLMAADLGTNPCPPPALTAELQRLGSPRLSLGGQSQDFTSPAPPASPPPSWEAAHDLHTAVELLVAARLPARRHEASR